MGPPPFLPVSTQDEREARETVKREQDEAYRLSLEADRKKVFSKLNWLCTQIHFSLFVMQHQMFKGKLH